MTELQKGNNIKCISGDILEVYFVLENIDIEQIDEVIFSCNGQQIENICEYVEEENAYALRLDSEETANLKDGIFSYDLTIKFVDGNYYTAVYNNALNILPKVNKISEVQYGES